MFASEAARAVAMTRLKAVRKTDALHAQGYARAVADALAAEEAGASANSVRRWRTTVRGLAAGDQLDALLDAPRPGRPPKIAGDVRELLKALVFHNPAHLTAEHCRRVLEARVGHAPAPSTLRHWLARFRREHARELSAVTNPDRHRSHRKPAGGDAAAGIERLNQLWELDSTTADVMCTDGKRYAIVAAIDVWSRRARVLVVPTSRATAIAALLRHCILTWGVPETVRTDEGRDYTSRHVTDVLAALALAHDPCPPYSPERKPFIERFLGTLTRDLFANLPGFTGHDVVGAQALRARKSFAARRAERPQSARCAERARNRQGRASGATHGEDLAETFGCALTADELQAWCDDWCRAVYERRPHDGLGGATPFARAAGWTGSVRHVHDERALDALLAEPAGNGWRTVRKGGIRLDNVDYIAGPLGPLVGERVRVRHDPADLDLIHVYHKPPEAKGFAFLCVAEDPARTGADRAAIAARMKATAGAADREARKRARDLAKRHRPERAMDDVLAKAVADADRAVALPRKGAAHETPALTQAAHAAKAADEADKAERAKTAPAHPVRRALSAAMRLYLEEQ